MSSIRIGWKNYQVAMRDEVLNEDGDECFGVIDHTDAVVTLRALNSFDQMKATILHEVLHGIGDMYGIDLCEEEITVLSNALYTFIVDNPHILNFKKESGI